MARASALLGIADILVCVLSDALVLQLGVSTSARQILLARGTQRHIRERRGIGSGDAQLAADRLHEMFSDLRFRLPPRQDANTFEVVGYVASAERWLRVVVKHVPAARTETGADEWWIRTAYPLGRKEFRRLKSAGKLVPLVS
jgi:hypothetical protein